MGGLMGKMLGMGQPGFNTNVNTGDPFQDAFQSGMVKPPEVGGGLGASPYLGAGMMGAGIGGMLGGPKYALPAAVGGAGLGLLAQHLFGGS